MSKQNGPRNEIVVCCLEAFLADDNTSYDIIDLNSNLGRNDVLRALLLFKAVASQKGPNSFTIRGFDLVFQAPSRFKEALSVLDHVEIAPEDMKKAAGADFEELADLICSKALIEGEKRLG